MNIRWIYREIFWSVMERPRNSRYMLNESVSIRQEPYLMARESLISHYNQVEMRLRPGCFGARRRMGDLVLAEFRHKESRRRNLRRHAPISERWARYSERLSGNYAIVGWHLASWMPPVA